MRCETVAYHADGVRLVGRLFVDEHRHLPRPGVLVAPEGLGLSEHTYGIAERLAEAGYIAFAMDYYGEGAALGMDEAMSHIGAFVAEPRRLRERASAALAVLAAQDLCAEGEIAAIGYCFGGTTALELARGGADLKAVVGFHSGFGWAHPEDSANIKGSVLVCLGADDPIVTEAHRAAFAVEMTRAGVDWRINLYGGAGHSFTNPAASALGRPGFAYHQIADERSWRAMIDLFDEVFSPDPSA